jgi:transposase
MMMSGSTLTVPRLSARQAVADAAFAADDGVVSDVHPRAGGPRRRRSFNRAEKLDHLGAYELACEQQQGGAYLRREGLYSSQVTEWRRLRDAGLLTAGPVGAADIAGVARVGRPTAEQAEIGRLRRQLEVTQRRLAGTEAALEIMGKAHALLEQISESAPREQPRRTR